MTEKISCLFVCLGNICRSPMAEGVFTALVSKHGLAGHFTLDSAGTGGWHAGEAPDPRSIRTAQNHGVDISHQRSRVLVPHDLERFDYIFAMDQSNHANILKRNPEAPTDVVHMFLSLTAGADAQVPDPYYDRDDGFEQVWGMVSEASAAWLSRICQEHGLSPSGL